MFRPAIFTVVDRALWGIRMLELLTRAANGYVLVPVTVSFRGRGGFKHLEAESSLPFDRLVEQMAANAGHLRVALRVFESLGWCAVDDRQRVHLTVDHRPYDLVPADLATLLEFPVGDTWLAQVGVDRFSQLAERCRNRWGISDETFAEMMDGALAVPLLLSLKSAGGFVPNQGRTILSCSDEARESLGMIFVDRGWASHQGQQLHLTELGQSFVDRIPITGTVASYRPMFARMDDLLFGNAGAVFQRDQQGDESHIDRRLNVESSGFQHGKFFSDLEEIIVDIFNNTALDEQPKYIADMGCGDGTLLKRIYRVICQRSIRGQALDRYPLTLIGIDCNQAALDATEQNLRGLPHQVVKGDIGDPQGLLTELANLGISDPESILHVRSFLDHDRSYRSPSAASSATIKGLGVYTHRNGQPIDGVSATQSLVEYLQGWSSITSKFGLIILEVHCLPPQVVCEFLSECENLHYDAFHGFSGQQLVEPEVFLKAAGVSGLFANPRELRRYPRLLPFTRITLNRFQRRPYSVRHARLEDLPALEILEEKCWPEALRTSKERLRRRIERYSEGQFVLEMNGQIVGVIYSQRIDDPDMLAAASDDNVEELHIASGRFAQLLAANIAPDLQQQGLGDQLLEFALQVFTVQAGTERVVGVTRCRDYRQNSGVSMPEYIRSRDPQGNLIDPLLRFHELHGAHIRKPLSGYRPRDHENDGYGVLIEYDLQNRDRRDVREAVSDSSAPTSRQAVADVVSSVIRPILSGASANSYSPSRALMDIGLDSLDLLELRTELSRRFQLEIDATFFFKHNTPDAIVDYLVEVSDTSIAASGCDVQATTMSSPDEADTAPDVRAELRDAPREAKSGLPANEPIAIVGIGCRFPGGADSPETYWDLLRDGKDAIGEIPADRWNMDEYYDRDPDAPGKMYVRQGGFIEDVDQFDPLFFGISPREAAAIDPQHRLLLETTWRSLEDAGVNPRELKGSNTGIFVGIGSDDYRHQHISSGETSRVDGFGYLGAHRALAAGRIGYVLGVHGPVVQLDTSCSSSLMAIVEACNSLRLGHCDLAVAGGVNLMLRPEDTIALCKLRALSPTNRCHTFDVSADGYVRGEGCGMVALKRLSDAVDSGDFVWAIVRGVAANHDGPSNGLTAPNGLAQEALLSRALKDAHLQPTDIDYVEAHGTGTPLGDPVEVQALAEILGKGRRPDQPLHIGSVKTNIGHLEAASGVAGMIKAALALHHGKLPPHLHLQEPNTHLAWADLPIQVASEFDTWPNSAKPRAGVSSFGISGTNVHVILEQHAPAAPRTSTPVHEPFQRRRHWVEPPSKSVISRESSLAAHELLGRQLLTAGRERIFENEISANRPHYLADHRAVDSVVLPAAAYVNMALALSPESPGTTMSLENLSLQQGLVLCCENPEIIQTVFRPDGTGGGFEVHRLVPSSKQNEWILHASGTLRLRSSLPKRSSLADFRKRCPNEIASEKFYTRMSDLRLDYGPTFQTVRQLWTGERTAVGRVELPSSVSDPHGSHPSLLDGCMQVALAAFSQEYPGVTHVPIRVQAVTLPDRPATAVWSCAQLRETGGLPVADICVFDLDSEMIGTIDGLTFQSVTKADFQRGKRDGPSAAPVRLEVKERGSLDGLKFEPSDRGSLETGEVEVRVQAAGLNFRDVLNTLGRYPEKVPLGLEFSGIVSRTGSGVDSTRCGDEVFGIGEGCFGDYITTTEKLVFRKPPALSIEEAAAIPIAFLTAHYALSEIANLQAGARVLIHSAAGGVGFAAVQLAKTIGAEVFGTASVSKWEFLKSCGVAHVMDSRTLDFADEVLAATGGKGVDLVLNSFTGEFVPKGLSVLSPQGQFIELGRADIWLPERVAAARADVSYSAFNLGEMIRDQPETLSPMFGELVRKFSKGLLPPPPVKAFPMAEATAAFRFMQQTRHVGKVVLVNSEKQFDQNVASLADVVGSRRLSDDRPDGKSESLETEVRNHLVAVLELTPDDVFDSQTDFFDLGVDSLTAVELHHRLEATSGMELPSTIVFDYPCIDELTEFLKAELAETDKKTPQPDDMIRTIGR